MDAVEERKKRIEALKQRKAQLLAEGNLKKDNQSSTQTIRFRNYTPKDESLKEKVDNVVINRKPLSYEEDLKAAADMPSRSEEINIAPKKPNWDLRRGIEHKMEILEKRTQKVMIQLLKEKIEAEEESEEDEE